MTVIAAGSLRVKGMLPTSIQGDFDPSVHLDKGGVQDLIADIVTKGGKEAGDSISNLSKEFFGQATSHGYSTPLSDYHNDSDDKKAIIEEFTTKIDQLNIADIPQEEKNDKINATTNAYSARLEAQNLNHLVDQRSTAALMALTKARGNPTQLMQGTASPLISKKIDGTPIPVPIQSSYAEGLSPAEQLAMSYWGRGNVVSAQLSTSKPGAMFKEITPNLYHEVVTIPDCHTTNGDIKHVDDKRSILDRFEAGTNHVIDEAYLKELKSSGKKDIKVRSTLTCEADEGVCQKCYGNDSRGGLPEIGENVGVVAAQSSSEVLTQMILSTKHDSKAGKKASPFDQVNNLLVNPSTFTDKATIATLNGKVTEIVETPLKDNKVFINGAEHFVPKDVGLNVKVGQNVKIGQALSGGTVNPRELVKLRGLGDGRRYLSNALNEVYESAGNKLDRRHFDLLARNMIKHVRIKEPGDTDFMPEQVLTVGALRDHLKDDSYKSHVNDSVGKMLSHQILHLSPGTVLDANHVDELKAREVNEVQLSKSGLQVEAMVPGLKSVKHLDNNWISKLATGHQARTLREGVAMGQSSDISSTDPIAAYVMGSDFGNGTNGRY